MTLGERLKTLRKERGWSLQYQRETIEQATGKRIALSYLSSLERSVQIAPSIIVLAHIAAGYDMSVQQLIHVVLFDVRSEHEMREPAADQRAVLREAGLAPAGGTLTAEEREAVSLGALALESLFSGEGSSPWLRVRNTRVKAIADAADTLKAIVERGAGDMGE